MNSINHLSLQYKNLVNNETNQGQSVNHFLKNCHNMKHKGKDLKNFYQMHHNLMLELERDAVYTIFDLNIYENWLGNNGEFGS